MTAPPNTQLRKTALHSTHRRMGAKMMNFGGWDMPIEYSGIISEHIATRTAAGLFDVSHMGEIEVRGIEALALMQSVTPNDAAKLTDGHAQYSGLLNDRGGFVDDLLVHRVSESHYLLCVNAANQDGDFEHIRARAGQRFGAEIENAGERYSQLALQGPKAPGILASLTATRLDALRYYQFTFGAVCGVKCLIARTGYTGEDGFELYFAPEHSEALWTALLDAGRPSGLLPCGLGARNTLRLEAGMRLYGHELDETTTVWEADLAWICKLDKGEFLGRKALVEQKARGIERILVGFEMTDRQIARDACGVSLGGAAIGRVTSGSPAPFLKKNIGMAYVNAGARAAGTQIEVDIRGTRAPARIVPLPFYKRAH
ncbi:MAG: glycine cleavage system aminomethyltransferase GcvT [Candidatus Acidiferrales bacterium]